MRLPTLRIKVRRKPGDISINVLLGTIRAGFEWRKQMFFGFDDTRQSNILELLRVAYKRQWRGALCLPLRVHPISCASEVQLSAEFPVLLLLIAIPFGVLGLPAAFLEFYCSTAISRPHHL